MNWTEKASHIFKAKRPHHFTDYKHCEECAEHDETLRNTDVDNISINELGNPGWDPVCFCTEEAKKYYMPSFVRLSLETVEGEFYFGQFLFHLECDGEKNTLIQSCTKEQRDFIASFVKYMIEAFPDEIDKNFYTDEVLRVYELWTMS